MTNGGMSATGAAAALGGAAAESQREYSGRIGAPFARPRSPDAAPRAAACEVL
jgi:hypothetical protein